MLEVLGLMAHKSKLVQRNLKGLPVKYAIQTLRYIIEDLEKCKDQEMLVGDVRKQLSFPINGEKKCDGSAQTGL